MKFRYGYVDHRPKKRLTPKSAFLRKLERMQRTLAQGVTVEIIDEVFSKPTETASKTPHLTLVRK